MLLFILAILVVAIIIVIAENNNGPNQYGPRNIFEPDEKRYGRQGERTATNVIQQILRKDDYLFTNVPISYNGKNTELDNVIVNKYGVFIIEVKNYKGRLYGSEDDYEWQKYKDDRYGNTFVKNVKNPIKQVKRQTYILAKYLDYYGVNVWVEGYALLIQGNSPVDSKFILSSVYDIDSAIHTFGRNRLSIQTIESIKKLFI